MNTKTLAELSEKMRDIDFTMLATHGPDGGIASRPMSNNRDVEYAGDSHFFTTESAQMVQDIERDPRVALTFSGAKSILGKPGIFIHVQGEAQLIRDRAEMEKHWVEDLDRWFEQGTATPGLVLVKVHASRIHYWDGEENGELLV
jgi:general stress protein 26